jgi:AraC-like DNA-binding protein
MAQDYRFIDKDPVVDLLRTLLEGRLPRGTINRLAADANLSPGTVMRLFYGETKRPQNFTVDNLLRAMGYERRLVRFEVRAAVDNGEEAKASSKKNPK